MHLYMANYRGVKLDKAACRQQRKSCRPGTYNNLSVCHSTQLYLKSLLKTQHEVPFIITSEVKEEIGDQTENDWVSQTVAESCRLVNPFDIMLLSALTDKKCGRSWNSRDLPKWVGRTETISLPFSKYSKHFTWSCFKQNVGKLQWLKADPSRIARTVSSPSWLWHLWLCKPR